MDLPYPTKKQHQLTQQLNQLDKLYRSILLSTKHIPKSDSLPPSLKSKIKKYITQDKPFKLSRIIEEQAIRFDSQIGTRGSQWNLLHFCAKNNSCDCLHYLLRTQYQMLEENYIEFVNEKTVEGYTPIVVAIINRSHRALEVLLSYGGIDIHVIDSSKMTPYEISLNYKNDKAIRLLMSYEATSKKKEYLNKEALREPVKIESSERCCDSLWDCLFGCLNIGFYPETRTNGDDMLKASILAAVSKQDEFIDFVQIGSKKQLPGYDIEWRRATEILSGKITLFDSYNPFSIRQNNFVIKNQLIIFQCLSQQPWLLRRIIKPDRIRNNFYNIQLHPKKIMERVTVDDHIPFIKDRKEAMFFSDEEELWPMLLQKGLAKLHEGFLNTNEIDCQALLSELTGFPTMSISIEQIGSENMYEFLQELTGKSYIYFLKGKQKSKLSEKEGTVECFNVLNFYEKDETFLVLVNCPFVREEWKQKQKNQMLALKLIKSHYHNPNQMCVWLDAKAFTEYFSALIVSFTYPNFQKNQIKIRSGKNIFCKFRIQQKREDSLIFQLNNADLQTQIPLSNVEIMRNDGVEEVYQQKGDKFADDLLYLPCLPGEYILYIEVEKSYLKYSTNENNLFINCWSTDPTQLEFIEEEFGVLQWFALLRNKFARIDEKCVVQCIGNMSLVMLRQINVRKVYLKRDIGEGEIMEGKLVRQGFVQMIESDVEVYYCVVRNVIRGEEIAFEYQ